MTRRLDRAMLMGGITRLRVRYSTRGPSDRGPWLIEGRYRDGWHWIDGFPTKRLAHRALREVGPPHEPRRSFRGRMRRMDRATRRLFGR